MGTVPIFGPTGGRGQLAAPATRTFPPQPPQPAQSVQPPQPAQKPPPEQLEQTVRTYYGLLPQDTTVAWQYLGPTEHAQGFQHYDKFWNGINGVKIRGPVAVQGNTVLVGLVFEPVNRKRTLERYRLTMSSSPEGRVLIESASRIGTSALADR
jgi:hypothetical protein